MNQTRKLFRLPLRAARKLVGDATVAAPTPASVPFSGSEDANRRCNTCLGTTRWLSSSLASGKRHHHLGVVSTARREPLFPCFKRYSASKMAALRATMPLFIHHLNNTRLLTPKQLAAFTPRQNGFKTCTNIQKKRSKDSLDKIASKLVIGKDPSKPLLYIKAGDMKMSGSKRSMSSDSKSSKCKKKKKKSRSRSRSKSKSKCKKKKSRSGSRSRSKSKGKKKSRSKSRSRSKSKGGSCTYIMKPKEKKASQKKITVEECCCYCDKRVREALDTLAAIVKCKAREIAEGSDDPFITGKKKKSRSKSKCKKKKKSKSRSRSKSKCKKKKSKSKSRSKSKCKKSKSKSSLKKKKSQCKNTKSAPGLGKKKSSKKIAGNLAKKCKSDSAVSKKSSKSLCKKKKKKKKKKKDKCKKKGKKGKEKGAPKFVCKKRYTKHLCKKRPSKKSKKKKKSKKDVCKKKKSKKDVCKKKKSKKDVCKKSKEKKSKKDVCKKSSKKKSSKSVCSKKSSKKMKKKKSSKSLCKKKSSKKMKKKSSSKSLCSKKSSKKMKKKKSACKKKSSKCVKKKKSSKDVCKKKSSKKLKKKSSSKSLCSKKSSKKLKKKKSVCKKKSSKSLKKKKSSKDLCKKKSSKKLKKKSSKSLCKKKSSKNLKKKKSLCKKPSKKKSKKDSMDEICKKLMKKKSKSKKKSKVKCNKSSASVGQNDYCVLKKSKSSKSVKKTQSAPCNAKLTKCPSSNEIKAVCEAQHKKSSKRKVKDPLAKCKKLVKKKSKKKPKKKEDGMTCVTPKQKLPDCLKEEKEKCKPKRCKPKKKKKKKKSKKGSKKCKKPKKKCGSILGGQEIVCPGQGIVGVKFLSTESVRADVESSPSARSVKYDSNLGKFMAHDSVRKTASEDKSLAKVPNSSQNKPERKSTGSVKYDRELGRFVEFDAVKKTPSEDKNLAKVPNFSQNQSKRKSTGSVKYDRELGRFVEFDAVKKTPSEDESLARVPCLPADQYDMNHEKFVAFDPVKKTPSENKSLARMPSFNQNKPERKSTGSVKHDRKVGKFVEFDAVKKTPSEDKSLARVPSFTQNKPDPKSVTTPTENVVVQLQDTKKDIAETDDMSIDEMVSKLAQDNIKPIPDNLSSSDEVSVSQMMHQYSMNEGSKEAQPDSTTSQTIFKPRKIQETGSLNYENEVLIASNDKVHKTMLNVPPDAEKIVLEIDLKNIQDGPVVTKITATPNHKVEVEQCRSQEADMNETEDIRKLNMPKDIAVKQPPKALSEVRLYTLQSPYRKQMVPHHLHKELKKYLKASGMEKPNTLVFQAKQVGPKKSDSKKLAAKNAVFDITREMHTGGHSIKDPLVNPLVRDMREPSFDTYSCREPMSMKLEIVDPCLGKASVVDPQTQWYGPVMCYGRDLTNKTFADIFPSGQKKEKKKSGNDVFDARKCGPPQEKPNDGVCEYYHPMEKPTSGVCTELTSLEDVICPKKRDTFYGRLFKLPVAIDECEVVITYIPKPEPSVWMTLKKQAMVRLAQRLRKEAEIRECCEEKRRANELCQMEPPAPVEYCTINFEELFQCNSIKQKSRQMQQECFKRLTARWNRMIDLRKRRQRKRLTHPPRYTDLPKRGTCATFMDSSQSFTMSPPGHELKPDYEYKGNAIATSQTVKSEWRSNVASTLELVAAQQNPNLEVYRDGTARQLCSDYEKCARKFKIIEAGHLGPSTCDPKRICTCQPKGKKDKGSKGDKGGKEKGKKKKKSSFIGSSIVPVMMFNPTMFDEVELAKRGLSFLPVYDPRFTPALLTSIACQFTEDSEGYIMSKAGTMLLQMYLMVGYVLPKELPKLHRKDASTVQLVREGSLKKKLPGDDEHANQSRDEKKLNAEEKKRSRENVVRAIASYFARLFPSTTNQRQVTGKKPSQEQKPLNEEASKTEQTASGMVVPKSTKDQAKQVSEYVRDVLKRRHQEHEILLTKKQHDTNKSLHEAEQKLKKSEDLLEEVANSIKALEEKIKGITDMTSAKERALKEKLNSYHSQMAQTQQTLEQHIAVQKRRLAAIKSTLSEVKGDAWKSLQKISTTTKKIDKLRRAGLEESNKMLPKEVKKMGDQWLSVMKQMKETIKSIDKPENWTKLQKQVEEIRNMVHKKVTDPTIEERLKNLEKHISHATTKYQSAHLKTKVKDLKDQLAKLKELADKTAAGGNASRGKMPSLKDLKAAAEEKKREIQKLLKEAEQQDAENKGKGKK